MILVVILNGVCYGILFKGGVYLENLCGVKVVVFDKIGMLINGILELIDWLFVENVDK